MTSYHCKSLLRGEIDMFSVSWLGKVTFPRAVPTNSNDSDQTVPPLPLSHNHANHIFILKCFGWNARSRALSIILHNRAPGDDISVIASSLFSALPKPYGTSSMSFAGPLRLIFYMSCPVIETDVMTPCSIEYLN